MTPNRFRKTVWDYYEKHARPMPWRNIQSPYKILVSEIMLQQTQVSRVMEKYPPFIKRFPTFKALAEAPQRDVLEEWMGLGYNRRGLNLKRTAEIVTRDYRGKLPRTHEELMKLPGIGPATAGALRAYVFNEPDVFIETNIRSVYIHHFLKKATDVTDKDLLPLIEKTVDRDNPREWYYALMDYGTHLKKTHGNASRKSAHYTRQSKFTGSTRELRAKILKHLLAHPSQTPTQITKAIDLKDKRIPAVLETLTRDGLITKAGSRYHVPQ